LNKTKNIKQNKKSILRHVGEPHIILEDEEFPLPDTSKISKRDFMRFVNHNLAYMNDEPTTLSQHYKNLLSGLWSGQ